MSTRRVPAVDLSPPNATTQRNRGPSLLARRPEISPIVAGLVAWVTLVVISPFTALTSLTPPPIQAQTTIEHFGHDSIFSPAGIAMVALMTVAMMAPLAIAGVRTVAFTSLWWRAGRASLWFLGAFLAAWTLIAVCLAPIAAAFGGLVGSPARAAGILLLACALAQFDPRRADLTKSCDRPMRLRTNGIDANVDCARFGLLTAGRGVRLCALPMIAMLALPASLLLMAVLTALSVADRITLGGRRLVIAALYLTVGAVLLL